jgi:hypothetical protein
MGALFTAHHLGCKAIIALTESGSTALWMSRHLIHVPIFGLTSKASSERRMTLYRNVQPILMPSHSDRDTALVEAERLLVQRGVSPGDTYAITCGELMGYPGGTNMLKVGRVATTRRPARCRARCSGPLEPRRRCCRCAVKSPNRLQRRVASSTFTEDCHGTRLQCASC